MAHVTLSVQGNIATITLNRPKALNALTLNDYQLLADLMRRAASDDAVVATVIKGTGKYFSAGADVNTNQGEAGASGDAEAARRFWLPRFAAGNIAVTKAFATHPKILIAALNGPVIGLSAALIAHCDLIYASDTTFLHTPFATLGLVAEGASSYLFAQRMGPSLANEALLCATRLPASRLAAAGFVNRVFPTEGFAEAVAEHIQKTFGPAANLDPQSLLRIKRLIRERDVREVEAANVVEHFEGLERFAEGVPQGRFAKMAASLAKAKARGNPKGKL